MPELQVLQVGRVEVSVENEVIPDKVYSMSKVMESCSSTNFWVDYEYFCVHGA